MKIKIEMEINQNGAVYVGVGECVPNEPWLMKHAEAIAREYAERVMGGKIDNDLDTDDEGIDLDIDIEDEDDDDEDEDELVPCDLCGELLPEEDLNGDGLCEGCAMQVEAEEEAEAELDEAEEELARAQEKVDRAREKLASL